MSETKNETKGSKEIVLERDYEALAPHEQYLLDTYIKASADDLQGEQRRLKAACFATRAINPNAALRSFTKIRQMADTAISRLTALCVLGGILLLTGCGGDGRKANAPAAERMVPTCEDGKCSLRAGNDN